MKAHLIFSLILLLQWSFSQAQDPLNIDFSVALKQLINNQRDSLSLASFGEIPAKQFVQEGWELFNLREEKELQDGGVQMERFRPIIKEDVLELRGDFVVVLLHEPSGSTIRLATLKIDGTPIQSFILHDKYGYLYEKNFRAFSFQEPYHFNSEQNVFEFYQLIYGYEPIPDLESPTQDPIYHQSFHQLKVNELGLFELVYSEDTGDIMFRREKQAPLIHEVEFYELSILSVSDANRPESALWQEKHLTHGDMGSHDSIVIALNYGAQWDRRFFFLEPKVNYEILKVSQRHENVMMFPGDGTSCELHNWKRYISPWQDLHCEEHFFETLSYNSEELQRFPDYSAEELLAAFRLGCGNENVLGDYHETNSLPRLDNCKIAPARIIIRIEYSGPSGKGLKHLIFEIANSC